MDVAEFDDINSNKSSDEEEETNKTIVHKAMREVQKATADTYASEKPISGYNTIGRKDVRTLQTNWKAFRKTRKNISLFANTLYSLSRAHPDMMAVWQIDLRVLDEDGARPFVHNMVELIHDIIESINLKSDHERALMLRDLGKLHLKHGVVERHFDAVQVCFLQELKKYFGITIKEKDFSAWQNLTQWMFGEIKTGLREERNNYIRNVPNQRGMERILAIWEIVRERDTEEIGSMLCKYAHRLYITIADEKGTIPDSLINIDYKSNEFKSFAIATIQALDLTIRNVPDNEGRLPELLKSYAHMYTMEGLIPIYVKKAFRLALHALVCAMIPNNASLVYTLQAFSQIYEVFAQTVIQVLESPEEF